MKYRLLFFMTEITLVVMVGLSAPEAFNGTLLGGNNGQWLIQLSPDTGTATFLLLIMINLLLLFLYFRPETDALWWLNLVTLTTLTFGVLTGFSSGHILVALSIVFALAYRRIQGLKHIWHWRGLLVVSIGIAVGLGIVAYGFR